MLFITLDSADAEIDNSIATHVLRMHRFQRTRDTAAAEETSDNEADDAEGQMWERNFRLFRPDSTGREVLSNGFLRKYIHYARTNIKPELSEDACDLIADAYAEFRNQEVDQYRNLPVTARSLETLIRLSTAYAKARLSNKVARVC